MNFKYKQIYLILGNDFKRNAALIFRDSILDGTPRMSLLDSNNLFWLRTIQIDVITDFSNFIINNNIDSKSKICKIGSIRECGPRYIIKRGNATTTTSGVYHFYSNSHILYKSRFNDGIISIGSNSITVGEARSKYAGYRFDSIY